MIGGRPYQERTAREVVPALWAQGYDAPLVTSPVGSGKTLMMAMLAEERLRLGRADFIQLSHRRELVEQQVATFRGLGIPAVGLLAGGRVPAPPADGSPLVLCASLGTLAHRQLRPARQNVVLSLDEGHLAVAPTWRAAMAQVRAAYARTKSVLWSGSPYRLDGRDLGDVSDVLYEAVTPPELFEEGWLVEPLVLGADDPDLAGVPRRGGDFVPEALAERMDRPKLMGNVVTTWIRHADGRPTILFATSRAHSAHLAERFREAGVRALHVDGSLRRLLPGALAGLAVGGLASTHPGALDVLCTVDLLTTGWDPASDYRRVTGDPAGWWLGRSFPPPRSPLCVMCDVRPTDSVCMYRQEEGRIVRPEQDKPWAKVLSHSGNWRRLGFLREHHGFSLGAPRNDAGSSRGGAAGPPAYAAKQCPACLAAWPPAMISCGCCGTSLAPEPEPLPAETEAEFRLVSEDAPRAAPPDPVGERQYMTGLWVSLLRRNAERREQGRQPIGDGQVAFQFKARYGRWPGREMSSAARRDARSRRSRR